ncbi:Crp/Fnr family transcriptional regulator [Gorillibacterium sp. CAU 1737]|uniref:Crp/Fnr family transcriptional regulator n=1 Tax=Gorillibacterium sp. CAU 1737 TaxID=3140362 RepID=UPI0032609154
MKEITNPAAVEQAIIEGGLSALFPEALRSKLVLCRFDVRENICNQGETPTQLYILIKGKMKCYTTSEQGNTLILSFLTPPEVIGDIEFIQGIPIMNTVEAVTPLEMIRVSYQAMHQFGMNHPPLLQFLLKIIGEKFQRKSSSLSFNLLHTAEARLAWYLLSNGFDEVDGEEAGMQVSSLKDTANLIGTSYRHVNRVLRRFIEDGLVKREKGMLTILDKERLRFIANEDSAD